jgi:hypothetical protein
VSGVISLALLSALLATSPPAVSDHSAPERLFGEKGTGAVLAPAQLPPNTTALYVMLGAPDLGVGFRQGFAAVELEARLFFNYLQAAAALEGSLRFLKFTRGIVSLAPSAGLGLVANSGSIYLDAANFGFVGLRPRVGLNGALRFTETISGVFLFDLPLTLALTARGIEVTPTVGAGAEVQFTSVLSGLLLGQVGLDVIKEPLGVTQARVGWAVRLGMGFRLF